MRAGRRSWRARLTTGVPLAILTLPVGIAIGVLGARVAASEIGHDTVVSPGPIPVGADQRTLAGSVGGSCQSGYLAIRETGRRCLLFHRGLLVSVLN